MRLSKAPFGFEDEEYHFQLLRTAGAASTGAAELGECFAAAAAIKEGNDATWYTSWRALADRVYGEAKHSQESGHVRSAISAFFRASNYYRTAEFFLHIQKDDPRIVETGRLSSSSFQQAISLNSLPVRKVDIPFESTILPGYLCLADHEVRPLLIVQTGFDGTMEELYFWYAQAAMERGMHCLVFEGPGQGSVLREQHLPFRPDWESVIASVVDFAVQHPLVDKSRLVLLGVSLGGYLAARALAFEKRIKIGIFNGGMVDFHDIATQGNKQIQSGLDDAETVKELDQVIYGMLKGSATLRWAIGHGMYAFDATSPCDWMRKTRDYRLGDLAARISCQVLVIDSDHDTLTRGQSQRLFDALRCPKDLMVFTTLEGAGDHCQAGSPRLSAERTFNWLEHLLSQ